MILIFTPFQIHIGQSYLSIQDFQVCLAHEHPLYGFHLLTVRSVVTTVPLHSCSDIVTSGENHSVELGKQALDKSRRFAY